jgi:hypothetical protein
VLRYGAVSKRVSPRQPRDRRRLHQFSSVGMRLNVRSCGIIGIRIIPLKPYCTMGGGGYSYSSVLEGKLFPSPIIYVCRIGNAFFRGHFRVTHPPTTTQHAALQKTKRQHCIWSIK